MGVRLSEYDELPEELEEGNHFNMDHPWVKSIVEDMPRFRPVFLFLIGIYNAIPHGRYPGAERRGSSKGLYEIGKQHRDKAAREGNELDLACWERFLTQLSQRMVDTSFAEARQQ